MSFMADPEPHGPAISHPTNNGSAPGPEPGRAGKVTHSTQTEPRPKVANGKALANAWVEVSALSLSADHFGSIPVEVSGNSPQPKPTDPPGGEQSVLNAGSDTLPVDVAAAWTEDRHTLTPAVLNPTETEQALNLNITGTALSGKGTLWRLASSDNNGQNPIISKIPIDSIPALLTLASFSINIYELHVR